MKLDCSPIVYPAVAGSTKPVLGQASALLKGYLFFNRGGLGAEPCTALLEEGATLLPELPSGDEKGRNSGGRESVCELLALPGEVHAGNWRLGSDLMAWV